MAERMVELDYDAETVSYEAVRRVLKKNELKPHLRKRWCLPPKARPSSSRRFAGGRTMRGTPMEDVLGRVYG